MKAFTYKKYGTSEVLQQSEVAIPKPRPNEILIKVAALSLNPAEWHKLRASLWVLRLSTGLFKPKNQILGADVAGVVTEVGSNVRSFKVGDKVLGRNYSGGLATYTCVEANKAAKIPKDVLFEHAAAIPLAAVTALMALQHQGQIQPKQQVLINGASGGIGTFAVQLAKFFQAEVTGVCSGKNWPLVRSLGANKVIDYEQEDFTQSGKTYDLIIDLVGNRSVTDLKRILKPQGRCILVGFTNAKNMLDFMVKGKWISGTSTQKFIPFNAEVNADSLEYLTRLIRHEDIVPIIDKTYDFDALPEAFEHLGSRRARGKIVVKLS